MYSAVRVITSVVKSDHKAVVVLSEGASSSHRKSKQRRTFRPKTPSQNVSFLQYLAESSPVFDDQYLSTETQAAYDFFYATALDLLSSFYPERTITVSSRDPSYITPEIKAKLRRKNRLMRVGRVEEASALARRIGRDIDRSSKRQLQNINSKVDAKELWAAVRTLTGRKQEAVVDASITAKSLNRHYAAISTDSSYVEPLLKQTVSVHLQEQQQQCITEYAVFHILDKLRPTATGLDNLPSWFLRLGAPVFSKPIADLFNLTLNTSTVPSQWKQACIRPIQKFPAPKQHADFRPISITPVLTRVMERLVVRQYLYPALLSPPPDLQFTDQFAFRPTGSTTAAIIYLLHIVTNLLSFNPYVIVISLDFSKAFDTVRHSTLLSKIAQLDLPDHIYNWLVDFFTGHSHCTSFSDQASEFANTNASIIQGSVIGPSAAYVVNAGDLKAITPGNFLCKYADDTYLIVPASNETSRSSELCNIQSWAQDNNLKLNCAKSREVIFTDPKRRRQHVDPSPIPGILRCQKLQILGVTLENDFSVTEHVQHLTTKSSQTLYALRVLRAHGLNDATLQEVYRSVVVSRLLYAASAWHGFTKASERQRINLLFDRAKRYGYCSPDQPTFEELCEMSDDQLFNKTVFNSSHTLHTLLPPPSTASQHYNLRRRTHTYSLPQHDTHLCDCNFLTRMLYKDSY